MSGAISRIGVALNERQQERLRGINARLGVQQSTLFAACADVLTDDEIVEIMRRFSEIKAADTAAKYLVKRG